MRHIIRGWPLRSALLVGFVALLATASVNHEPAADTRDDFDRYVESLDSADVIEAKAADGTKIKIRAVANWRDYYPQCNDR